MGRGWEGFCSYNCIQLTHMYFWYKLFLHRELLWKLCLSQFNNNKKELAFLESSKYFNIRYLISSSLVLIPFTPFSLPSFLHSFRTSLCLSKYLGHRDSILWVIHLIPSILSPCQLLNIFLLSSSMERKGG